MTDLEQRLHQAFPDLVERQDFLSRVDASDYSLEAWLEALDYFQAWLQRRAREQNKAIMLGYLECCAKSTESKVSLLSLKNVLSEMLKQHGYQG